MRSHSLTLRAINLASHCLYRISESCKVVYLRRRMAAAGVANATEIRTWTTARELFTLHALAEACPPNAAVVEVGSYIGASSCYLAAGLSARGGRLYCIDTWQNETVPEGLRDTYREFSENTRTVAHIVVPLRKRSDQLVSDDLPDKLNLVFLDGDHSYGAVHHELSFLAPRIVLGGVVAFHDAIAFEGVAKVVGEALASGSWQFGDKVDNLIWLRKVDRWTEPVFIPPTHA